MKIKEIIFYNYKIYKGKNSVVFDTNQKNNINLIGGKNGFGKTTFLSGLVWLFYGKMMSQVEDKYRQDIKSAKGYPNYLKSLLNNDIRETLGRKSYSVSVELTDVQIPSIPCDSILLIRSYNCITEEEDLSILIDGQPNELTRQVGFEIFINDFILPREIAKFFFFDAEKIVSLAEAKTKVELRALSKAYSEVLGIKKYEDLKTNLNALMTKLRRDGANEYEKEELNRLLKIENDFTNQILELEESRTCIDDEIKTLKIEADRLQEKLIREGSSITIKELKELKNEKLALEGKGSNLKIELKRFFDIIPFVLAGKLTEKLYDQLIKEKDRINSDLILDKSNKKIEEFSLKLEDRINFINGDLNTKEQILKELNKLLLETDLEKPKEIKLLLNLSESSTKEFQTLFHYLKSSFVIQFETLVQNVKNNKVRLNRVRSKIREAEARKNNALNNELRSQKDIIERRIFDSELKIENLISEIAALKVRKNNNLKILSEYEKNFNFSELARKKYKATEEILNKVNLMIHRIKEEKKFTLQKSILREIKRLFHKKDFIAEIDVKIYDDYMDVELINFNGEIIDKNELSKGEQQLYATSILKALVDESGIDFPIFIDSPLQKLDPEHARNVITEFYPNISEQVVLFPLLEKELNVDEYELLKPNLSKTYLIENTDNEGSNLVLYNKNEIFKAFNKN
ncbi:DNA sulfur modification protein DndD [Flavobacteriaceae bacterium Ap0902]|nr:DNA sulfur modification protein DndD [Flavobacteriaceae bacterium Ap0902]